MQNISLFRMRDVYIESWENWIGDILTITSKMIS